MDRVHHVADHTRARRRYHSAPLRRVVLSTVMLLVIALPILAGDNVRRAGTHARLSTRRQLAVRVLHGGVLQDQTLNLFPLGRSVRNSRVLVFRERVVRGLDDITPHHVLGDNLRVAVDDWRLVPVDCGFRVVGERRRNVDPDRSGQSEGGRVRSLQLLALAVPVRPHFPTACFRVAGLVPAVATIILRVQQVVPIGAAVGGCLLASRLPARRRTHIGVGLLTQQHAGGTLHDAARHRRF